MRSGNTGKVRYETVFRKQFNQLLNSLGYEDIVVSLSNALFR